MSNLIDKRRVIDAWGESDINVVRVDLLCFVNIDNLAGTEAGSLWILAGTD